MGEECFTFHRPSANVALNVNGVKYTRTSEPKSYIQKEKYKSQARVDKYVTVLRVNENPHGLLRSQRETQNK